MEQVTAIAVKAVTTDETQTVITVNATVKTEAYASGSGMSERRKLSIFAAIVGGIASGFRAIKERIQDYLERKRARKIQQQAQTDDTPYGTYSNSKHKKVIIMPPLEPGIDDQSDK